ncbi:unnamed protein product [Mytilus coruscus]|uniref:Uncharacterized protein n=1 Tax=Mytilus coruscus TaxID=42192 RepID=A0A6J8A493_MYTCO|nr:unnamed protein product [Mytilus coruscus]
MNGQLQYRGLPAPPHEAVIFEGDGMPPPCPREMYSQAGVYDVIPGDPHNQRRQKKPATPQRSPSTRLSSQSVQDDVFTDHPHSPRQHTSQQQFTHHPQQSNIAHQQQILRQQPASPKTKQKHMSHPDPSQSKPFSYFGSAGPAPLVHRHSEGQLQYRTERSPSDSNYEQVNNYHNGQTRTGYEHMSPSYYREPQMGGGIGHHSGSPVLQRQSSLTRKASLSPVMSRRHESPKTSNQRASGQRGPPSFPAPTAPGYVRPVSPPLPPHPVGYDQPPPPPPIEKIPGHQSVTSFELGRKKRQSGETDINRNQVQDPHLQYPRQQSTEGYSPLQSQQGYYPGHHTDPYSPTHQQHNTGLVYQQQQPYGAGSPQQQQYYNQQQQQYNQQQQQYIQQQQQHIQQQQYTQQQMSSQVPYTPPVQPVSGGGLADQLIKVKLKSKSVSEGSEEKKAGELAAELGKVKLKPAKPKENMSPPPEKKEESPAGFLTKLKPTGAKPWEKDNSPEQIPQQEVVIEEQFDEDYFPPPPPDLEELSSPEPVNGFQTTPTSSKPQQKKGGGAPSLSKMADIEIDLNNIDYNQIPGYTPITAAVPNWKRDMIEKKNQEKVEEYIEYLKRKEMQLRRQKEEQEKWKNVPEWKRKILMEKAQLKQNEDFEMDEARKQKEKKKFESPDQVKLKPVKPKSESQLKETLPETMDTKPLQEIKQNIPALETKKPEVLKTIQTKNIVLVETDKLPPPPPPAVVEKPKKSTPDPDLPPPPPPPDVMDDGEREEERRRREEKRREIEAQMDQEEDSGKNVRKVSLKKK